MSAFDRRVLLLMGVFLALLSIDAAACRIHDDGPSATAEAPAGESPAREPAPEEPFATARERMVAGQIAARGVKDPRVLEAMRRVPRHLFVPEPLRLSAYEDYPLPIGEAQTISQPYIVALMTEMLRAGPGEKVLEVGTGSGYQAAVLGAMGVEVYTIEIVESLGLQAAARLEEMGYENVHVRVGDGYRGWPEAAPFDAVIVTAAPDHVPAPLVEQLREGGRIVIPVGSAQQDLLCLVKRAGSLDEEARVPVRFVPMTGEAQSGPS